MLTKHCLVIRVVEDSESHDTFGLNCLTQFTILVLLYQFRIGNLNTMYLDALVFI